MCLRAAGPLMLGTALLLALGCGPYDDDNGIDEEVLCRVDTLEVTDSTNAGEAISVHLAGIVGPDTCYHLDRIEQESIGRKRVLRPIAHHYVRPHTCCPEVIIHFDETLRLDPPDSGWVLVEAESSGPHLVDSTYVRPSPAPADTFTYLCYYLDVPTVTGWFTMRRVRPGQISGEWHFSYVDEPVLVGPQVGDGRLVGTAVGDYIVINLNPGWADANVYLDGVLAGDKYEGDWTFSSFTGAERQGRFEAQRR